MALYRYGVFQVGGLWTVSDEQRPVVSYYGRDEAINAARQMAAKARRGGDAAELHFMDVDGRLTLAQNDPPTELTC